MSRLMNERDQQFILYELLKADLWFKDLSRADFNQILGAAKELAENMLYPALQEGDVKGCRLENGRILVPTCFHRLKKIFDDGGWSSLGISKENGGQGLSFIAWMAVGEWFVHNTAFFTYTNRTMGVAYLIDSFGTQQQKKHYLPKLVTGAWGGPVSVTEAQAGSDLMNIRTTALRQSDGTYLIEGTKTMISNGDADMFSNMIYAVLARVQGAPPGLGGLSLFIVPKYRINGDGTLGARNDYKILNLEKKMGVNGWGVCTTCFGDNASCYAELLGKENQGLSLFMAIMPPSQISLGIWACGVASAAYCHALAYARERKQGAGPADAYNPAAPRLPIIEHPDVRRMLLWMKAHVEGMRGLTYYCALLIDKIKLSKNEEEKKAHTRLCEILTPVCRVYSSDMAFKVTEQAMQVFGGSGYFKDYPMEQFMRDIKPASLVEGANGIQALQLVALGMGENGGNFTFLLEEMTQTIISYQTDDRIQTLVQDVQSRITLLGDVGLNFTQRKKQGDLLVPIAHAYPFLQMLGIVCMGWILLWQAGIARSKLETAREGSKALAFYERKIQSAKFFILNCLPQADGIGLAIQKADLSMMDISTASF